MVGPVLQLGVKAQFYLASKGKYTFEACEWAKPKETKRREARGSILAPLSPEILTPALGPSFVLFSWAFSFLCLLATAILDSFFLF